MGSFINTRIEQIHDCSQAEFDRLTSIKTPSLYDELGLCKIEIENDFKQNGNAAKRALIKLTRSKNRTGQVQLYFAIESNKGQKKSFSSLDDKIISKTRTLTSFFKKNMHLPSFKKLLDAGRRASKRLHDPFKGLNP
jgi:hypothetical protein